jgi:hypothetical protein
MTHHRIFRRSAGTSVSTKPWRTGCASIQHPAGERWNKVRVPVAPSGPGVVVMEFSIDAPRSPSEVGLSGDTRRLGLGVLEVELRAFD